MKPNKKLFTTGFAIAALALVAVSFQNCSQGSSSSSDSSTSTTSNTTSGTTASALGYPVSSALVLSPGQNITLKVAKPSTVSDLSQYIWYAYNDGGTLVSHYGSIVENNGTMYISISVRTSVTAVKDLRVYLYNYSTQTYLDGNGILLRLSPSASNPYTSDFVSDVCDLRPNYVPTFAVNKSAAAASAITIMDNGAGVGALSCTIGGTAYDCLTPSGWPSDWASKTIKITGYNRCGVSATSSY